MANQGTVKILAGTRYDRRPDPSVSNLPNSLGLYPWSVLYAHLGRIVEGDVSIALSVPNSAGAFAQMLIFTSDIPVLGQLKCYHEAATNAPYLNDMTNIDSVNYLVTELGGSTPVSVQRGQVAIGYTGPTRSVYCSGFPIAARIKVAGASGQTTTEAALMVWANSGVINGPVSSLDDAGDTTVPTPLILDTGDYTTAIRDNNNIFTDASGYKWLVVGLHNLFD